MIYNFWPPWFRQLLPGGGWPTSYVCVDVETTGFSPTEDVVTQWGHCFVEDGAVVDRLSLVIDWSGRDVPPDHWLQTRIAQCERGMASQGKTCQTPYARLKAEGRPPETAFAFIKRFTDTVKAKGIPFVLHGGVFDEKMLSANFLAYKFGAGFTFGDLVFDTEAIEKASQIPTHERVHPRRTDTLRTYFHRVKYTKVAGVTSNLDEHCFAKYRLHEHGVDRKDLHDARVDSYCCHLLMQAFGKLAAAPEPPPIYPSADHKAAAQDRPIVPRVAATPGRRMRGQRRS